MNLLIVKTEKYIIRNTYGVILISDDLDEAFKVLRREGCRYSMTLDYSEDVAPEIKGMCRAFSHEGQAIACIKVLRRLADLGLAESKRLYDYCVDEEPQALDFAPYRNTRYIV